MANEGQKRVTLRQIAEATGLSRMAVSLALRGHHSLPARTRARVRSAARRLGYQPDANLATLMARLRGGAGTGESATLMLLNLSQWAGLLQERTTFRRFVAGARTRAAELGFSLDTLWAGDPQMTPRRLRTILTARGVQGALIAWIEGDLRAPDPREFFGGPMVQLGRRLEGLEGDLISNDQFMTARTGGLRLWSRGARRLGLVIGEADRVVDYRYSGGFRSLESALPGVSLAGVFNPDRATAAEFAAWWRSDRPDGILTHDVRTVEWLRATGGGARQTRVASLNWTADRPELPGMDQRSELIGEIAVDRLVARIRLPGAQTASAQGVFVQSLWREAARERRTP